MVTSRVELMMAVGRSWSGPPLRSPCWRRYSGPARWTAATTSRHLATLRRPGRRRSVERLRSVAPTPESFGRPLASFVVNGSSLVDQLAGASHTGDLDVLRRQSHTLKSNAASFGATALAGLCATLESRARAGTTDGAANLVAKIADAFETAIESLEALT